MIQDHMESIEKEKVILTVPKFIFSDDGFSQKGASLDRDPAGELEEIQTISGTDRLWLVAPTTVYH